MNDMQIVGLALLLLMAAIIGLFVLIIIVYWLFKAYFKELQNNLNLFKLDYQNHIHDLQIITSAVADLEAQVKGDKNAAD